MSRISSERLRTILNGARDKRVAVIGDFMLDRHLRGTVKRISPEAPVPVVEIDTETSGLGGAGNVISNLAGLGVKPLAFGVIGDDRAGEMLRMHVQTDGGNGDGLIVSKDRKTTEKIRIIADDQHVVRADRESVQAMKPAEEDRLLDRVRSSIGDIDGAILQDYNKGVLTERIIRELIRLLNDAKIPVSVDPKFDNFLTYERVHLFKPNVKEVERALGRRAETEEQIREIGKDLRARLRPDILMITRGEKGVALFSGAEEPHTIPTKARDVHDVSGAGDTVISTFAATDLGGASPLEAAEIANLAGGIVCGHVGVVAITIPELFDAAEMLQ